MKASKGFDDTCSRVRALCGGLPDEYFRKIDADRGQPVEFVGVDTDRVRRVGLKPDRRVRHHPRPLDGITVAAIEHAIAARFCTRQLADMGARVIKVERPGPEDFARQYDSRVNGLASHFVWTDRSKESIALDVKDPEASEVLGELVNRVDVLVQNLAPGAAARLGFGYDTLSVVHPRLIVEALFP